MRRAFTSSNLQVDQQPSLAKSPSIVSKRSRSDLRTPAEVVPAKRPNTTFGLCSPPDAIEPLPPVIPETEPTKVRSNKSSPFLTASASLRVFFGREGFVARSLSSAFDKDVKADQTDEKGRLKSRISAPLSAQKPEDKDEEKQFRENVLTQALSLSMSSSLNRLADLPADTIKGTRGKTGSKMVSSSSRPRLGIPPELLSAASVTEMGELTEMTKRQTSSGTRYNTEADVRRSKREVTPSEDGLETLAEIGEAMLRHGGAINSIDSGLNLKATQNGRFVPGEDAPAVPILSPIRDLAQIGKEESMASASV